MILSPPKKPRVHPFALVTPGNRTLSVQTLSGTRVARGKRDVADALAKLSKHVVYVAGSLRPLLDVSDPTEWFMSTWRSRPVSMTHKPSGVVVTSLRNALNNAPDQFSALVQVMTWLEDYGVHPGTISGMSWNLLRASLHEDVSIAFDPNVSEAAFFGGRQEIWSPDVYTNMVALDIKAAYPHAMSSEPIALGLREVDRSSELTDEAGFAAAEVFVPFDLPYAPLPVRVAPRAIQFQYHEIKGIWTWRELRAAKSLGCHVRVTKCWAPRRTYDLFGPWWDMAKTGRSLSPGADMVAKMIANATWGQFAMRGEEKVELHFTGRDDLDFAEVRVPARTLPHVYAKHVASEIASRVRVQTLVEGLYGSSNFVAHVDTDGLIAHESSKLPANSGDGFGQWRVKEHMSEIEVRAPQLYRYRVGRDPAWHFIAAGMSIDGARREFKKRQRTRTMISYLSEDDVVLPSMKSHQRREREEMLDQVREAVA